MVTAIIGLPLKRGLDPELVTQGSIYGDRPGAIHKPDSVESLEQCYNPPAGGPAGQARRNFDEINQGQTNENNHDGDISGAAKHECAEDRNEEISDGHPSVRRGA